TARPSGSSRTTPWPTTTSATRCGLRAGCSRRSRPTARPFASRRTTPRLTHGWARPSSKRAGCRRPRRRTGRPGHPRKKVWAPPPARLGAAPELPATYNGLGKVLQAGGKDAEAEGSLRKALALRRKLSPPERSPAGHPALATSLNNLAETLTHQGKHAVAEK